MNSYGYAEGNPATYSDPYGLCARNKRGVEDPECRMVANALLAAANDTDKKLSAGTRNLFRDAAAGYIATDRDVQFVDAHDPRLNEDDYNIDADPETFAMGRTMPPAMWGIPKLLGVPGALGRSGDILIGNFLGRGDFLMTAAHETLVHGQQGVLGGDHTAPVKQLNRDLWFQLPAGNRPSAPLWAQKIRKGG